MEFDSLPKNSQIFLSAADGLLIPIQSDQSAARGTLLQDCPGMATAPHGSIYINSAGPAIQIFDYFGQQDRTMLAVFHALLNPQVG
jgi:hypothetical protein